MSKFAWNDKTTEFFVKAYLAALGAGTVEEKAHANSEEFITATMEEFAASNDGLKPVSVRSVRQKLASEKVYVKLEVGEKPKTERVPRGKKINAVAKLAEVISKLHGLDESEVFDAILSVENANARCIQQLISLFEAGTLLPPEDDGSKGEQ